MSASMNRDPKANGINEWTMMFFFASDNELAPLIVSQLKGIKDAGYHEKAEVVVYFDPKEKNAQTRVYNVNAARKRAKPSNNKTHIGDSSSFVRNLLEDDVSPPLEAARGPESRAVRDRELPAQDALTNFLDYCAKNHRASHYMLFLVGHGMIVGNDAFLPDEQPVSSITLEKLGLILGGFNNAAGGTLELLAMHSCSMSGVEVAYQLKGTASFMMASQGPSFVGSWPYRQLMIRTFQAIEDKKAQSSADIGVLVEKLYGLSFYNARDFWVSGYPLDLCLCSLEKKKFEGLTEALRQLVINLKEGLSDGRSKELILLAHLESQSYWGESYTDIYDFCRCLSARCGTEALQTKIKTACEGVMLKLEPVDSPDAIKRLEALVVHSRTFGWKFQYSNGLSVYFPWAKPIEDEDILKIYEGYAFTKELGEHSWLSFLEYYFTKTQRPREARSRFPTDDPTIDVSPQKATAAAAAGVGVGVGGNISNRLIGVLSDEKTVGSVGEACSCPSIKNYLIDLS